MRQQKYREMDRGIQYAVSWAHQWIVLKQYNRVRLAGFHVEWLFSPLASDGGGRGRKIRELQMPVNVGID